MKEAQSDSTSRLKYRLVARGLQQKEGKDYIHIFTTVVKWSTVKSLSTIADACKWTIYHLDVRSVFLIVLFQKPSM